MYSTSLVLPKNTENFLLIKPINLKYNRNLNNFIQKLLITGLKPEFYEANIYQANAGDPGTISNLVKLHIKTCLTYLTSLTPSLYETGLEFGELEGQLCELVVALEGFMAQH